MLRWLDFAKKLEQLQKIIVFSPFNWEYEKSVVSEMGVVWVSK